MMKFINWNWYLMTLTWNYQSNSIWKKKTILNDFLLIKFINWNWYLMILTWNYLSNSIWKRKKLILNEFLLIKYINQSWYLMTLTSNYQSNSIWKKKINLKWISTDEIHQSELIFNDININQSIEFNKKSQSKSLNEFLLIKFINWNWYLIISTSNYLSNSICKKKINLKWFFTDEIHKLKLIFNDINMKLSIKFNL